MSGSRRVRQSCFFLLFRKTNRWFLWLVRRLTCRNFRRRASIFPNSVLTSAFLCVSSPLMFSSGEHERKASTKQYQENKNPRLFHAVEIVCRDQPESNELFQRLLSLCHWEGGYLMRKLQPRIKRVLESLKRFSRPSLATNQHSFWNLSIDLMDYHNHQMSRDTKTLM